jgi:hypothetical protein
MKALPISSDKIAISLSMLCVAHCLAFPLLIVLLPSITVLSSQKEVFHLCMVIAVIPISIYALTLGCKEHKRLKVAVIGSLGLVCLIMAVLLGENRIGELGEKLMTIIGALLISFSHYQNFQFCQSTANCPCPSEDS